MERFRAVFFGTPAIAVPTLRALVEVADVAAVVCQPDRPVGRDSKPQPPPVKTLAEQLGIEVAQPIKVRTPDFASWVASKRADVGVVIAYGRILTPAVLTAPRLGCVNFHASILPRYRGAAPITWAVVRGERESGVTLMQMDAGLDTGPTYVARRVSIGDDETAGELAERLAALAAEMTGDELVGVVGGRYRATPQDNDAATLAPILIKDDGRIDWSARAIDVHNHVRGMSPWPGAFTTLGGKTLKLLRTRVAEEDAGGEPGETRVVGRKRVVVACGEGSIELLTAQLEGRKALGGAELVGGRAIADGDRLGSAKPA